MRNRPMGAYQAVTPVRRYVQIWSGEISNHDRPLRNRVDQSSILGQNGERESESGICLLGLELPGQPE